VRKFMSLLGLAALAAAGWRFRSRLCALLGCDNEVIRIDLPSLGASVASPVVVSGWGRATQHNELVVEVRDSSNAVIGSRDARCLEVEPIAGIFEMRFRGGRIARRASLQPRVGQFRQDVRTLVSLLAGRG
jgi:hypothetical protein